MYRIYRNLNTNTWTVQHKVPGKGWRKKESVDRLWAHDAEFIISAAGRDRVRREKRKNVHAYAVVNYYRTDEFADVDTWGDDEWNIKWISYNPYDDRGFRVIDGPDNVTTARDVAFTPSGRIAATTIFTR